MNPFQQFAFKCEVFLCDYSNVITRGLWQPLSLIRAPLQLCSEHIIRKTIFAIKSAGSLFPKGHISILLQLVGFPLQGCEVREPTLCLAMCGDPLYLQDPVRHSAGTRGTFCISLKSHGTGLAEPLHSAACLIPQLATSQFGLLLNLVRFYIYLSIAEKELNDPS